MHENVIIGQPTQRMTMLSATLNETNEKSQGAPLDKELQVTHDCRER